MSLIYKNVLITGGSGFIGSNFLKLILQKYPNTNFVNLDLLTYASNKKNTESFKDFNNYFFYKGDICDFDFVSKIFVKHNIDALINFAAESHVDNSIINPHLFIKTNVLGTHNLLKISFKHWMKSPHIHKTDYKNSRFHQISTDEVYGSISHGSFKESSNYSPNSPYSASKASADMLVRSYHKTYGLNTTITLSSNNYGPGQHDEKFIPTIIKSLLCDKEIPLYGSGDNVRDWIFVEENCKAIEMVFKNGISGESYNIGAKNELTNNDLINKIYKIYSTNKDYPDRKLKIKFVNDRFGHDFRYSLDISKIKELGWRLSDDNDMQLLKLIDYYVFK